ncbi:hypothetical protein KO561_10100 [Radiobacillus kanasensis]|uniref:hypothetical protein n=1 Tax=Radiobacillus kanasensis TaxID=2844358 RepID=UPI001E2E2F03|nr:hypothetical protein [Radiobacillus kanasensis]UFU01261.1 hypothetical protein KO561_10100 [Radiobacillus kanasensis]
MKKFLLALGLISAFVIAGCSQSDEGTDKEKSSEEEKASESDVKTVLLDEQENFTDTFSPFQQTINAYQATIGDDEVTPEERAAAAEEALTAAKNAQTELENYEVSADLSDDMKESYTNALTTLKDYYAEVASAIEANADAADFTAAQTKWDEYQSAIGSIFEDADLLAPNMADALS